MKGFVLSFVHAVTGKKGKWITLAVWILLAGVLSAVFPSVQKETDNGASDLPSSVMSVKAQKIADKYFPNNSGTPLLVVWYRSGGLEEKDYNLVSKMYQKLEDKPLDTQNFIPPFSKIPPQALKAQASKDGTSLVTPVFMKKGASTEQLDSDLNTLKKQIESEGSSTAIFDKKLSDSGLHIRFSGPVGIATDATALFSKADVTLLISTVVIVLVLLILLYRSPILAIIPLIGVGFAYAVTGPILGMLAKQDVISIDSQAVSIMTVLLFGAGTDYCLFLVSKYRECLLEEKNPTKALQQAIHHSGGAIMVSAITVVVSLCTLLLAQYGSYQRFATPFSLVILIMGFAALTLMPALLSIFGRVSFFPFIPRTEEMTQKLEEKKGKKIKRRVAHGAISKKLGHFVTGKPWTVIIISVVILGVLAAFVPRIQYSQNLIASFPKDMPSREGFDLMAKHFTPGELAPVQVIVDTEGKDVQLKKSLSGLSFVESVTDPSVSSKNKHYVSVNLNLKTDPYDNQSVKDIPKIKSKVESTLKDAGIKPADNYWIGGETSNLYDTEHATDRDFKVIVPVVIVIIAALLLIYLRSIVAMVYLIATVALSYLSALGAGWILLHYGLGISSMQGLIPLYAFVFLVALGEDYNIFMISSIWKNRHTQPHKRAIANGVTQTSSVITSAGLILAGTFAVLATLPIQVLLQFGLVTAIGVLLDTFVVRPLLVPAITTVLGRYAFWPGKLWKKKDQEETTNNA